MNSAGGTRKSFFGHVSFSNLWICEARDRLEGRTAVSHISRKTSEMPLNFLYAALDRTECAALFKERRRRFREPTKLHRKSGVWDTRHWWRG
jgi:hypothetical protein